MDKQRYFENIESYKLLAKHEVGQNFLVDSDICQRIVGALDIQLNEEVLEIGSGAGSLTYFLSESKGHVTAIDIDEGLIAKLQGELEGVNVLYGNAAKWDYAPYDKIIGNLPYYITSLIIERVLLHSNKAKKLVFMIQKEAAERILAPVSTKDYGPLPILVSLYGKAKRLFNVGRHCFVPAPHVDSCVIEIVRDGEDIETLNRVYKLTQSLFLQRRKTLLNNLKNYLHDGEFARDALMHLGLKETARPEEVTPDQYLALADFLARK